MPSVTVAVESEIVAFGFPAYHETVVILGGDAEARRRTMAEAIEKLGWSLREETSDTVLARARWGTASMGEWIKVSGLEAGTVLIRSECGYPTQCVDWGRNRANVESLVAALGSQAILSK